jgi:guanylate kinase
MTKDSGRLFVISAPSGAGKTSLISALVEEMANLVISLSYTTRAKRPGEIDGVHYDFVPQETFDQLLEQDEFLEHAQVFDYHYGTSKKWVAERLAKGYDILLEIDWQGARQVKSLFPHQYVNVFIAPPSLENLEERLIARRQDSVEIIATRMAKAREEMSHYDEYDYLVVNSQFDEALRDMKAIITAERLKTRYQAYNVKQLLEK